MNEDILKNTEPVLLQVKFKVDKEELDKLKIDQFKQYREQQEEAARKNEEFIDSIYNVADAIDMMSNVSFDTASDTIQSFANIAAGIGSLIPEIMKLIGANEGVALSEGIKNASAMPFPANVAAVAQIVGSLMSVFATISSLAGYATGGVVQGATVGDYNLIRANGGEMILNNRQQANLFRLLDGVISQSATSMPDKIELVARGRNLIGTINNEQNKMRKVL